MDTNFENQKQQMLKPAMNFGLFFGTILIIYTVLTWVLNLMMERYIGYINYFIMIACLYFFSRKFRDEYNNGFITYGKTIKFSALILIFASFILGFYNFIFFKFIEPGMIDTIIEKSREMMLEKNADLTEEQVDMAISMQKKFMSPIMMFVTSFIGTYVLGIIFSLLTSIFVMKKDKSFDDSSFQQPLT